MSAVSSDAAMARHMAADMATRLNASLHHLVVDVLERPNWAEIPDPSPAVFGLGAMMRDRALAGDLDAVAAVLDRFGPVLARRDGRGDLVQALAEPWLNAAEIEILRHGFADDVGLTTNLLPPSSDVAKAVSRTVSLALRAVGEACPEWHQEFEALVKLVVLAGSPSGAQRFAGASAFDLWGAILVNPVAHDPLRLIMTLVHESSHLKLFHAYIDDEVVLNDPAETYSSPLRSEPRPMNGLFHAAYVLARMAMFAADMAEADGASDVFGPDGRASFRNEVEAAGASFDAAYDIIARDGRLTAGGSRIIAAAAAGVDAARRRVASAHRPSCAAG